MLCTETELSNQGVLSESLSRLYTPMPMNSGVQPVNGSTSRRLAKRWENGMYSRCHPCHDQCPSNRERKVSMLQPSFTNRGWVGREERKGAGTTTRNHGMTVRNTYWDVRAFIHNIRFITQYFYYVYFYVVI